MKPLATHGRFAYRPIRGRARHDWPNGTRLALYIGFNVEHFAFGEGLGARLVPPAAGVDVLNYGWREWGNRVGAWRCLDLFESLGVTVAAIVNSAICAHAPALIDAFVARGDEIVAHGRSNAEAQGGLAEDDERALLLDCRAELLRATGSAPLGWLSPWISESASTCDLLVETGYRYTLNWCHDDQPTRLATRAGPLWSIPYPQETNDIPMIVARQMTGTDFATMLVDHFDEMLEQSQDAPLVMGIALHPYLVGQPHRLRPLRRALQHLAASKATWWTTPGRICDAVELIAPPSA
ncbi:MAG TPA: polysaccharide deacetylase family protein [Caldimonas sp.]|jgi:peptidoglycan/xylan/chitin deacetylase (PgdA/CDA1 family)|nr:polysaccharide deacetylase family protein [Caldimonas sp.]